MILILAIDWEKLLANGVTPTIILVIIGIISKYTIWPRVAQYLDDARNERIEAQKILRERAQSLEERERTQLTGFTKALEGLQDALETSSRRQETQILMMKEILEVTKETNGLTKKSGK